MSERGGNETKALASLGSLERDEPRGRGARRRRRAGEGARADVLRPWPLFAAGLAGAVVTASLALAFPPPGGHGALGPLARPHARAGLECASCHREGAGERFTKREANRACARCHGEHASRRKAHRALASEGALACSDCHGVHRSEEGVTFFEGGGAVRFAPGAEEDASASAGSFTPLVDTTVALVPRDACLRCHGAREGDVAARCFPGGADGERMSACFDEHQAPTRDDTRGAPLPSPPDGACKLQHGEARPIAWQAARAVAASHPIVRPARYAGAPLWLGGGALASLLGYGLTHVLLARRASRRASRAPEAPEPPLEPRARARLPVIDTTTCLGCYACVDACPYGVLEVERYVAQVARPDACCGLLLCEQRCPNGSLRVGEGERVVDERVRLSPSLESVERPGVFLAGDVTGTPLIKNAIAQGARAADAAADALAREARRERGAQLDLLVVGAGPAGLSAALRARERGLSVRVVERSTVAASIKSFPRGKLVFDPPLELPVVGKLWLEESTKEELLAQWLRIVRRERLEVDEHTRALSARPIEGGFSVALEREGREEHTRARAIVLAIGQRGTPRLLDAPIDEGAESAVHYHLADARSHAGRRVVVVGLGDVAMEAAVALAGQPGTEVTVLARGAGFSRGSPRNVEQVKRLAREGKLTLVHRATVASVHAGELVARVEAADGRGHTTRRVPFDALFVLIGSIPPWTTLEAFGLRAGGAARGAAQIDPATST